jgi:hypothetical protein
MSPAPRPAKSWPRRLGWFVLIWAASVSAMGLAALALRLVMNASGLTV